MSHHLRRSSRLRNRPPDDETSGCTGSTRLRGTGTGTLRTSRQRTSLLRGPLYLKTARLKGIARVVEDIAGGECQRRPSLPLWLSSALTSVSSQEASAKSAFTAARCPLLLGLRQDRCQHQVRPSHAPRTFKAPPCLACLASGTF